MILAFDFNVNTDVVPGLVTLGKFEASNLSLAVGTPEGNVLIHNSHNESGKRNAVRTLNINRKITSICWASWDKDSPDILLVGTETNLMAYDAYNNVDLFYNDIPDGIGVVTFGPVLSTGPSLAVVGGTCSIQGFNEKGGEDFWTVCGDMVRAIIFVDIDGDGEQELVVGADDYEIRVFKQEEIIFELSELDAVLFLTALDNGCFAYGLANGTIGVYEKKSRLWDVKTKRKITWLSSVYIRHQQFLLVGWGHGLLELRRWQTGRVEFSEKLRSGIAGIVCGDYRMDGTTQIVVVTDKGVVRGYLPETINPKEESENRVLERLEDVKKENETLKSKLERFKKNIALFKEGNLAPGSIPPDTEIACTVVPSLKEKTLKLKITTNNKTLVKCVVIFADKIFHGESMVYYVDDYAQSVEVPLTLDKDVSCELRINAIVGHRSCQQDHVFELAYKIPIFASYVYMSTQEIKVPESFVKCRLTERMNLLNRVVLWLNQSFLINYEATGGKYKIDIAFTSLRGDNTLVLWMQGGVLTIRSDSMSLCGDVIQSICSYMNITELDTTSEFPKEMRRFEETLERVKEYNSIRLQLSTEIADQSNIIKNLVISAEDARMIGDMPAMRRCYAQLMEWNQAQIAEYTKRANNHAKLLASLKEVNNMIQKAAKLRVGKAKAKVVSDCRKAIKENNVQNLHYLMLNKKQDSFSMSAERSMSPPNQL